MGCEMISEIKYESQVQNEIINNEMETVGCEKISEIKCLSLKCKMKYMCNDEWNKDTSKKPKSSQNVFKSRHFYLLHLFNSSPLLLKIWKVSIHFSYLSRKTYIVDIHYKVPHWGTSNEYLQCKFS